MTWRDHGVPGGGQVTVVFATPATPDLVLRSPSKGAIDPAGVPGDAWDKWQGMWVCSHKDHQQWVLVTPWPTAKADWFVPNKTVMYTEGKDAVGVWAPTFPNGGAPDFDKPFDPVTT